MGSILKFELIKIMRKKTSIIIMAFSMAIILYLFGGIAFQERTFDENGDEYKGLSAIALEKEMYKAVTGEMTEQSITNDIKLYQEKFNDPNNVTQVDENNTMFFKDKIYWEFLCPKKDYYTLISETYDKPFEYGRFTSLPYISIDNGANFYDARLEKINKLLNQEYLDANYTQAEKGFWLNMNEKVEEPLTYGYAKGWINLLSSTGLWFFMVLSICICIAPIFASEYQTGMDSLIFTSKYGRSKLITAKILAAFLYGSGVFVLNIGLSLMVVLIPFGIDGWNLPIQIMDTISPYPLNFLQAIGIYILIAYLIVLAFISFNLVLSVSMKSAYPVIIIDTLILIIPFFMVYSEKSYLYNHIYPLLPTKAMEMSLSYFTNFTFGKIIISWPTMIEIVYFLFAIVLLPIVFIKYRKHQIR